jgi:hypothetical protein
MFDDAYNLDLEFSCGRRLTFLFLRTFAIFEFEILLSAATIDIMSRSIIIMMTNFQWERACEGEESCI